MRVGKYILSKDSIRNRIVSGLRGLNSKSYWDSRFKRLSASGGRVQTMLFALGVGKALDAHQELHAQVDSILDYGAACGDSAPVLRFFLSMRVLRCGTLRPLPKPMQRNTIASSQLF